METATSHATPKSEQLIQTALRHRPLWNDRDPHAVPDTANDKQIDNIISCCGQWWDEKHLPIAATGHQTTDGLIFAVAIRRSYRVVAVRTCVPGGTEMDAVKYRPSFWGDVG